MFSPVLTVRFVPLPYFLYTKILFSVESTMIFVYDDVIMT